MFIIFSYVFLFIIVYCDYLILLKNYLKLEKVDVRIILDVLMQLPLITMKLQFKMMVVVLMIVLFLQEQIMRQFQLLLMEVHSNMKFLGKYLTLMEIVYFLHHH